MKRIKIVIIALFFGGSFMYAQSNANNASNTFSSDEQQPEQTAQTGQTAQTDADPGGGGLGGDDSVPINQYIPVLAAVGLLLTAIYSRKRFAKN